MQQFASLVRLGDTASGHSAFPARDQPQDGEGARPHLVSAGKCLARARIALTVPATLATRPLSARSLLRTLRLALCDGGGRAGAGSATPSITLAFAPASRLANCSLMNSIDRSICSSVMALMSPECSTWSSRGTRYAQIFI